MRLLAALLRDGCAQRGAGADYGPVVSGMINLRASYLGRNQGLQPPIPWRKACSARLKTLGCHVRGCPVYLQPPKLAA